jgi:uncharacterized heparinase superfamily protein
MYVLQHQDLFLLFNASTARSGRPTSHRHNDALSIEVSACDRAFIVDPGTFVYTADLNDRHLFRSTGYHSTIQIDDAEQNSIAETAPFTIGVEARARVLRWETGADADLVVVEHSGYERLSQPVTHRRSITFHKHDRWWLIEDEILGSGDHSIAIRFHFDAGLQVSSAEGYVKATDEAGATLFVSSLDRKGQPRLEDQFVSRAYGAKGPAITVCWTMKITAPSHFRWAIWPVCPGESEEARSLLIDTRSKSAG